MLSMYGIKPLISWISSTQLTALGLNVSYVYFTMIFIVIIISYYLIQPFVSWFVILNSKNLLSYIISSLFVITLFLIIAVKVDMPRDSIFSLLKQILYCLATLGVFLIIIQSVSVFIRRTNKI